MDASRDQAPRCNARVIVAYQTRPVCDYCICIVAMLGLPITINITVIKTVMMLVVALGEDAVAHGRQE